MRCEFSTNKSNPFWIDTQIPLFAYDLSSNQVNKTCLYQVLCTDFFYCYTMLLRNIFITQYLKKVLFILEAWEIVVVLKIKKKLHKLCKLKGFCEKQNNIIGLEKFVVEYSECFFVWWPK